MNMSYELYLSAQHANYIEITINPGKKENKDV